MTTINLLLLPGDGIGPEVMAETKRVIEFFDKQGAAKFNVEEDLVGGSAFDAHKKAISEDAMKKAHAADAILLGAVGGPKWASVPYDARPEAGLLRLRKDLQLFANLRPAICYPALADDSSLKRELVEGLDILAGIFKSYFFGAAIALISCHRGFNSSAGAEGVGKAATEAFVLSFMAILFLDFVLGLGWNTVYRSLWPQASGLL